MKVISRRNKFGREFSVKTGSNLHSDAVNESKADNIAAKMGKQLKFVVIVFGGAPGAKLKWDKLRDRMIPFRRLLFPIRKCWQLLINYCGPNSISCCSCFRLQGSVRSRDGGEKVPRNKTGPAR